MRRTSRGAKDRQLRWPVLLGLLLLTLGCGAHMPSPAPSGATAADELEDFAAFVEAVPRPFRERVTPLYGASLDLLRAYPGEAVDGLHVREGDPLAALMTPATPRLLARLAVFVDGHTNSAANELLLALRATRPDAVVLGEEVGGECERHVGELPVAYVTPVYGVAVALSLIRIEHAAVPGCQLGHGLTPDVPVSYTRGDFVDGRDPYVAALDAVW